MMSKYMQVVWMYLIGILIIFFGIIMLTMKSGPSSFLVMLVGLAVAAIGAAHGRRMRALGQMDVRQLVGERGEEETRKEMKKEKEPAEAQEEKPAGPGIGSMLGKFVGSLRSRAGGELSEGDIDSIEMEDMKRGNIAATSADEIELVCPKCMAENEEQNYYCFKCGNKLRKSQKEKGGEKSGIAVEPGTISVVGDRKIAKVVICPKCNLANKVGDKYCWNCGKKIRSESASAAYAASVASATRAASPSVPRARHSLSEIDAIFSEPAGRKKGRKGKRKAKTNLKNADEIKS
ncbi:MAG: zinc ribbon domain-containing protein [Candidatus Aenigmatarchaeota archaeon]